MIRGINYPAKLKTYGAGKLSSPRGDLLTKTTKSNFCTADGGYKRADQSICTYNLHEKQGGEGGLTQIISCEGNPFQFGRQAVLSLHFTWPHLAPVSIIPALPFQISMSGCWSRNTNTVGTPRSVSTEPTLICTNARGYTCSTHTDPLSTQTHIFYPSYWLLCASLRGGKEPSII